MLKIEAERQLHVLALITFTSTETIRARVVDLPTPKYPHY